MLIVRRPFKSMGKQYFIGDIIKSPGDIKFYRSKLYYRQLIRITLDDPKLDDLIAYMESRANKALREQIMEGLQKENAIEEPRVFDLGNIANEDKSDDKVNSGESAEGANTPQVSAFTSLRKKENDVDV